MKEEKSMKYKANKKKIMKLNTSFFEMTRNIDKPLVKLIKKIIQITNISNEIRNLTTDPMDVKELKIFQHFIL